MKWGCCRCGQKGSGKAGKLPKILTAGWGRERVGRFMASRVCHIEALTMAEKGHWGIWGSW